MFGNCAGTATECLLEEQRFRDSVAKAREALEGLDPKSKEAKELKATLDKLGDEKRFNNLVFRGRETSRPRVFSSYHLSIPKASFPEHSKNLVRGQEYRRGMTSQN